VYSGFTMHNLTRKKSYDLDSDSTSHQFGETASPPRKIVKKTKHDPVAKLELT